MRRYPLYGNVIVDSSNSTALGGTLTISNSCNTSLLNNRASIAFAVADISYGALKKGLFSNNVDTADARITAIVDTVSPTVGTGLSISVSPNHANPPVEALRIRSNGNVGIGTQTPEFPLDVNGSARIGSVGGNLTIGRNNNSSAVGSIGGQLFFAGTAGDSATVNDGGTILNRIYENNTEKSELVLFKGNDSGSGNGPDRIRLRAAALAFDTFPATSNSFTDENIRMFINKDGNVGIGTTSPEFPLDVNGNIRLGTGTTGNIRFGSSGVGTTQAGYIDLVNNTMTVMNHQNGNLILGTNNGEDMRILTNGNVGIGTQTPHFTLDVNGNARIGTTSTNTFTLFNNPFRYVPWTNIYNYSGTGTPSFTSVVTAQITAPGPANSTATRINYMYSVVGNTLYINYYYFHTAGGTTGNGIYLYLLPSGFTVTSINTALRNNFSGLGASNINNGIKIGTGSIYEQNVINKVVSCYYTEISSAGYIVLFSDVTGQSNYHRNNVNAYNTYPLYVTFEAAIPLA